MFNMSGFELILIGIVALIVIGPERLPEVARTVGTWIGKAKKMASHVHDEVMSDPTKDENDKNNDPK